MQTLERPEAQTTSRKKRISPDRLWRDHMATKSPETREALIHHYLYLTKYVVDRLNVRESGSVSKDDLISHAIMGLIDAIEKYNPDRGVKFESYASTRIRGSVMDMLRSLDWVPRSVRRAEREVRETYARLESEMGRPATEEEVAEELNLSVEELESTLSDLSHVAVSSLEDSLNGSAESEGELSLADTIKDLAGDDSSPLARAEAQDKRRLLTEAIGTLSERERMVVGLYYYEGLTLKEIGKVLDVTEARISQIHSKAVMRLNGKLQRFQPSFCG